MNFCTAKREYLFNELFKEEYEETEQETSCSLAVSSNNRLFALKKLGSYNDRYPSLVVFNHQLQKISAFFCGNGGEQGLAFWPDDEHLLSGGFAQDHKEQERLLKDGLKVYNIYQPQTYSNPFLKLNLKATQRVNCDVKLCSQDGRYVLISSNGQILIDAVEQQWQAVPQVRYTPRAFSKGNRFLVSARGLHLGGDYSIHTLPNGEEIQSGSGFITVNTAADSMYLKGYSSESGHFIEERAMTGETKRTIHYTLEGSAGGISPDNRYLCVGRYDGGMSVVNLEDVSEEYRYTEDDATSPFYQQYPSEVFFLQDTRYAVAFYWGVGIRIFEY